MFLEECGPGLSSPLAAVNGAGETLVAWQNVYGYSGEFCTAASAEATVGSMSEGFSAAGVVSPSGQKSFPTGAFLDEAGDGWVIGMNETLAPNNSKYNLIEYDNPGVWYAFRRTGGGFQAPVLLPTGNSHAANATVAGNRYGETVLTWNTERGSYVAVGSPAGTISKPRFYGNEFQITTAAIDEHGRVLVVGYYPSRRYVDTAIAIDVITGSATGVLFRPRVVVRPRTRVKRGFRERVSTPLAAIGPDGNAIIAWETAIEAVTSLYEIRGPTLMLYRGANGQLTKARPLPRDFTVEHEVNGDVATMDGTGRASILAGTARRGLVDLDIASGGRVGSCHRVGPSGATFPRMSGNAAGQTVAVWSDGSSSINYVSGDTRGTYGHLHTIAVPGKLRYELATVIDPDGNATAVWITEEPKGRSTINAEALASGAQLVPVTTSEAAK